MIFGKNKSNPTPKFMSSETQDLDSASSSFLAKLSEVHNASFFSQRMQNYEETIENIQKSLKLIKQETKNHDYLPSIFQLKSYKILRTLQLSAALSFLKNHSLALLYGKKALKSALSLSKSILEVVVNMHKAVLSKKEKTEVNEKIMKIRKILEKISEENYEPGVLLTQDWIYEYNMGNMMIVQEFKFSDWDKTMKDIISYTFISKLVFLLIASYFTISTETRLTESNQSNSKVWYKKSIEVCKCFLPTTSALFQHIIASYKKHFKTIKEDKKFFVPSVRRINLKRGSEKCSKTLEKSQNKYVSKLTPPKKLTNSTRNASSKIRISRLKQNIRKSTPIDDQRNSSISLSKSSNMLKDYLTQDNKTGQLLSRNLNRSKGKKEKNSSSEDFDRNL